MRKLECDGCGEDVTKQPRWAEQVVYKEYLPGEGRYGRSESAHTGEVFCEKCKKAKVKKARKVRASA